jgi:hypothetical protein
MYLVAVFVCDEIRANTSEFSISLHRLAKQARLSYATAQRSIAALVKAEILEVIRPHTRYTAPIYRLAVVCPDLCGDLRDHNTQQELAWIEALRKPQHTPKSVSDVSECDNSIGVSATYIKQTEEEDIAILQNFVEGSLELAILLDLLKQPKTALEEEILISATKHPKTMSQTLLSLLPKSIEGEKRIRAYLAKVLSDSPERLKLNIELLLAQQTSSHLIATSTEKKTAKKGIDLPDYKVAITKDRFNSWITKCTGVESDFAWLSNYYGNSETEPPKAYEAIKFGYIEQFFRQLTNSETNEDPIVKDWLKQGLIQLVPSRDVALDKFVFLHSIEFEQAKTKSWSSELAQKHFIQVQEGITDLYCNLVSTPEEKAKAAYTKQRELSWLEANPKARRHQYFSSSEYKAEDEAGNLFELSKHVVADRLLDFYNELIFKGKANNTALPESSYKEDFMIYLKETFTLQDDLDILLKLIPERPEGHKKHVRKFATAYLELLATKDFPTIKRLLYNEVSKDRWITEGKQLEGSTYSLAPDRYLLKVVEESGAPDWISKLREQAI